MVVCMLTKTITQFWQEVTGRMPRIGSMHLMSIEDTH